MCTVLILSGIVNVDSHTAKADIVTAVTAIFAGETHVAA